MGNLGYITLISGLLISGVAAYYSIFGLIAIFAAAVIPVAIMGTALEIGKLVAASWLYQNWERAGILMKSYLTSAVLILIFITSMGIFGFLSKAHVEQETYTQDNSIYLEEINSRINDEKQRISDANDVIAQLDGAVAVLIEYDRIRGPTGSIATREKQLEERQQLSAIINDARSNISKYRNERLELQKERVGLEAEVGPIKYIAELVYGETNQQILDKSVRAVIIVIVFVFDPLAILLLLAANHSFKHRFDEPLPEPILHNEDAPKKPVNSWDEAKEIIDEVGHDDDEFDSSIIQDDGVAEYDVKKT